MTDIRALTNDRALQDYLLLNHWPNGFESGWRPVKISGLACLTVIIKMINSCLPLEARTTDNPMRQLEEKNPLMRHAWLDFQCTEDDEGYARAAVKLFEALSLGNRPSFEDLVSSGSLHSTLWARPEQCFCFDPISSDSALLSHENYEGGTFTVIRLGASAPFNLGTLIDQELDRVIGKDIRCRNNPEFLRLDYSAVYGHRTAVDELYTFDIRERCLINQSNGDMGDHGRVTYVLRAAVRLQQNGMNGLDEVQLFTQSRELRWDWLVEDDWFGDPGYTWFLLYWKINPGYQVGGPSAEWADSRIEENSEGPQDESRHVDNSTTRAEHESALTTENSASFAVPDQSSSKHGHQIFSLRRPLSGWAPPKQTPDPATHKLMTGNDLLQRDERNANVICGHCSALGHGLIDCIWPGPFGDIDGCPICNTTEHRLDNCRAFEATDYNIPRLELLHHVLIVRRANKPPILTRLVWISIACAYVNRHKGKYIQNSVGYPWTKFLSMEVWKNTFKDANKQFWLTYDYSKDSENQSRLQVDPVTRDWQTALQNKELILEDQRQHGWNAVEYLHY
ncbi:hypothetical protein CFIO01_12221 [Colletotrichum fioriniae PJ7]|uniref:Uncharacterized protein n=1 Tax=Colletotrichum fioriniae PJ7 TaxID=1445577 RepID=A0A010RGM2_9PEZI|nr:hypothetical protein CFIO01_12221 [Colletotrichum fioriniae PJ7]